MLDDKKLRQALRVFHIITSHGAKMGSDYQLNGITASPGFDGYSASLRNDYVSLDIFFHNKYAFNFTSKKERDTFLEVLAKLDKHYNKNTP